MPPRLKVMVIEDDRAMARMCAKLIHRRGHSAVIASSSNDALDIIRDTAIDVVISDIQMPEIGGIQLLGRLRAIDQTLPVILMTGYAYLFNQAQSIALGAAGYITKPFDPETFIGTLERAARSRNNVAHS